MDLANIEHFYEKQNKYFIQRKKKLKNKCKASKHRFFTKGNILIEEVFKDNIIHSSGKLISKSIDINKEINKIKFNLNKLKKELTFYKKTIIEKELDIQEELSKYENHIIKKYHKLNELYKNYLNLEVFLNQEKDKNLETYKTEINKFQFRRLKLKTQIHDSLEKLKTEVDSQERGKIKRNLIVMSKELDNFSNIEDLAVGSLVYTAGQKSGIVMQIEDTRATILTDLENTPKLETYNITDLNKFKALNNMIHYYHDLLLENKSFMDEKRYLEKKEECNLLTDIEQEYLSHIEDTDVVIEDRKKHTLDIKDFEFVLEEEDIVLRTKIEKKSIVIAKLQELYGKLEVSHNDFYKTLNENMVEILDITSEEYYNNYQEWIYNFVTDFWKLNVDAEELEERLRKYVIAVPSVKNSVPKYVSQIRDLEDELSFNMDELGIHKHKGVSKSMSFVKKTSTEPSTDNSTGLYSKEHSREILRRDIPTSRFKNIDERIEKMSHQLHEWSQGLQNDDIDTFCSTSAHYDWWSFPSTKAAGTGSHANFKISTLLDLFDYVTQDTKIPVIDNDRKIYEGQQDYYDLLKTIPSDELTKGVNYSALYISLVKLYCESLGIGGTPICTLEKGTNNNEDRYGKILRSLNEWITILGYLNNNDEIKETYRELQYNLTSYAEFLCGKFLKRASKNHPKKLFNKSFCNDDLYELYFRLRYLKSIEEVSGKEEDTQLVFEDESGMSEAVGVLKNLYNNLGSDGSARKHQEVMQKILRAGNLDNMLQDRKQARAIAEQAKKEEENRRSREAKRTREEVAARREELERKRGEARIKRIQQESISAQRRQTQKLLQIVRSLKDRPVYQKWLQNSTDNSDEAYLAHLIPVFEYLANSMGKEISTLEAKDFDKLGEKVSAYKTLFETYNEQLKSQGLQLESTFGDGDCLFYALVNSLCRLKAYPELDDCNVTIQKRVSPSGENKNVKVQAALHIRKVIAQKILQNIEGLLQFVNIYRHGDPDVPADTGSGEDFSNAIMTLFNLNTGELQKAIYNVKIASGSVSKESISSIDIRNISGLEEIDILRKVMEIYANKIKYSANRSHFKYGVYSNDETLIPGIWGGSIEIMMASAIYNCNIQVHHAETHFAAKNRRIFSQGVRYNDDNEIEFVIAHLGERNKHYVSTVPYQSPGKGEEPIGHSSSVASDATQSITSILGASSDATHSVVSGKVSAATELIDDFELDDGDFELDEFSD